MSKEGNIEPAALMKVRLRQHHLQYLLNRAEGAVGRMHPYFLLCAGGPRVTCGATDLNISIVSGIELHDDEQIEAGGTVCVPAHKLSALVKSLPDAFIDLSALDGLRLQVVCNDYEGIIPCVDPDEHFPSIVLPDGVADFYCAGDLVPELHAACAHALDKRGKNHLLGGLHLRAENDVLVAAATDGARLAVAGKRDEAGFGTAFANGITIPAKALAELKKINTGNTGVYLRDNDLTFIQRGISLLVRLLEGDYPAFRRVIPTGYPYCCVVEAGQLAAIVERVNILSAADSIMLDIKQGDDGISGDILISAENEAGRSMDLVPAEVGGESLQMRISPAFLVDALRSLEKTSKDIVIKYKDDQSALVLLPCDHSGWDERVEVVMPQRVVNPAHAATVPILRRHLCKKSPVHHAKVKAASSATAPARLSCSPGLCEGRDE